MKYLLDTNACISYLNTASLMIRRHIELLSPYDIVVCSVVKAELYYGAVKSQHPQKTLDKLNFFLEQFNSLPFDDRAARCFGEIRAALAQRGTPVGPYDLQIAAIGLAHNVTVVTHNTREFSRVPNLKIVDWESAE
jgi:tRNA(fMet)-specific endonuclease VapC